jgi:hypothetical protein
MSVGASRKLQLNVTAFHSRFEAETTDAVAEMNACTCEMPQGSNLKEGC